MPTHFSCQYGNWAIGAPVPLGVLQGTAEAGVRRGAEPNLAGGAVPLIVLQDEEDDDPSTFVYRALSKPIEGKPEDYKGFVGFFRGLRDQLFAPLAKGLLLDYWFGPQLPQTKAEADEAFQALVIPRTAEEGRRADVFKAGIALQIVTFRAAFVSRGAAPFSRLSQDINYSSRVVLPVATPPLIIIKPVPFPSKVTNTLRHVRNTGKPPTGFEGGRVFRNREGLLPSGGSYREYDVDPLPPVGMSRNAERIVIDKSTGRAWFTSDHYKTFTEIK